jgi:hypothetical protein
MATHASAEARPCAPIRPGVFFQDHFDGQLLQAARTQKLAEIVHDLREAAMVDVGDDFNWGWSQVQLKRNLVSKRFLILFHTRIMRAVFRPGRRKTPRPGLPYTHKVLASKALTIWDGLCLGFDGVFAGAVKGFDSEVLLDPFEEQLDLPSAFVDFRDGGGGRSEVVGNEDKTFAGFFVDVADASELVGVVSLALGTLQTNSLVAAQTDIFVNWTGGADVVSHAAFGTGHKKSSRLVDTIQTCKIDVSTIHYIDASRLEIDIVENVHVVDATVGNADKHGDRAFQVDHCVQFDGGFCAAKVSPWEPGQAKVDSRSIQGVDHLVDVQSVTLAGIKTPRLTNQNLGQIGIDTPVPVLVCIGQIGACDIAPESHCVEVPTAAQARLDVPKALAEGHLRKRHRQKMVPCGEPSTFPLHWVAGRTALKLLTVQSVHDLGENGPAFVHPLLRMGLPGLRHSIQMRHTSFLAYCTQNQSLAELNAGFSRTPVTPSMKTSLFKATYERSEQGGSERTNFISRD